MEKLKQEDKDKLSKILNDNWDVIFKILTNTTKDEGGIPYKEVYKWELEGAMESLIGKIDAHLECNNYFSREHFKGWLIEEIISNLLGSIDCRDFRIAHCVNQLYNMISFVFKPYYVNLYPANTNVSNMAVIETNLSMKDGEVYDYQSRVIEIDDWDNYVSIFTNYDGTPIDKFIPITNMLGCSIPKDVKIENLVHDEKHLSCDFTRDNGFEMKKLAYKCAMK